MTATNTYLMIDPKEIKIPLVREVSRYIFDILKVFGIYEEGDYPAVVGANTDGSEVRVTFE